VRHVRRRQPPCKRHRHQLRRTVEVGERFPILDFRFCILDCRSASPAQSKIGNPKSAIQNPQSQIRRFGRREQLGRGVAPRDKDFASPNVVARTRMVQCDERLSRFGRGITSWSPELASGPPRRLSPWGRVQHQTGASSSSFFATARLVLVERCFDAAGSVAPFEKRWPSAVNIAPRWRAAWWRNHRREGRGSGSEHRSTEASSAGASNAPLARSIGWRRRLSSADPSRYRIPGIAKNSRILERNQAVSNPPGLRESPLPHPHRKNMAAATARR
jgi:hypothetical protein